MDGRSPPSGLDDAWEAAAWSAVTGCDAIIADDGWPLADAAAASVPLSTGDSCCSTACTTRRRFRSPTLTSTCARGGAAEIRHWGPRCGAASGYVCAALPAH